MGSGVFFGSLFARYVFSGSDFFRMLAFFAGVTGSTVARTLVRHPNRRARVRRRRAASTTVCGPTSSWSLPLFLSSWSGYFSEDALNEAGGAT